MSILSRVGFFAVGPPRAAEEMITGETQVGQRSDTRNPSCDVSTPPFRKTRPRPRFNRSSAHSGPFIPRVGRQRNTREVSVYVAVSVLAFNSSGGGACLYMAWLSLPPVYQLAP